MFHCIALLWLAVSKIWPYLEWKSFLIHIIGWSPNISSSYSTFLPKWPLLDDASQMFNQPYAPLNQNFSSQDLARCKILKFMPYYNTKANCQIYKVKTQDSRQYKYVWVIEFISKNGKKMILLLSWHRGKPWIKLQFEGITLYHT